MSKGSNVSFGQGLFRGRDDTGTKTPRVQVVIGTTRGPVRVQSMGLADGAQQSVMCIDGQAVETRVSRGYHLFVARGTGAIEQRYGSGPYRLDVSGEIDTGHSWQLGAIAAHALHAVGRLADEFRSNTEGPSTEDKSDVIWTTGAVRAATLTVERVEAVAEKLQRSMDVLCQWTAEGRRVGVVLPRENIADISVAQSELLRRHGIRVKTVRTVAELEGLVSRITRSTEAAQWYRSPWLPRAAGVLGVLLTAVLATVWWRGATPRAADKQEVYDPLKIVRPKRLATSFPCDHYITVSPHKESSGRTLASDLICSVESLAEIDRRMGDAYNAFRNELPQLDQKAEKAEQVAWIAVRNEKCGAKNFDVLADGSSTRVVTCLENEIELRLQYYLKKRETSAWKNK